jgi:DNA repair protein RadA/Sms
MVLAVLQRRGQVRLSDSDVYASTVGGVRLVEPATDLAVALAVASAAQEYPLPLGLVVIGEVGLAGEIRRVAGVGQRLAEAARLGFTKALVPVGSGEPPPDFLCLEVQHLSGALGALASGLRQLD